MFTGEGLYKAVGLYQGNSGYAFFDLLNNTVRTPATRCFVKVDEYVMLQNPVTHSAKPSVTTYKSALEWLFAQTRGGTPRSAERMRMLMTRLELKSPPNVVHVVGTNGKGSVAAMVAAGYEAAGRRTGRFISPHVESFRERITVDGQWISEAEVLRFMQNLPGLEPTPAFFELTLALALRHFAQERIEVAVIEAGVGAKHDATRTLENVRSVVITNVGHDHLDTLGPTARDVACDKADAVRPGVPTLTGATGEALEVISEVATERGSLLFVVSPDAPQNLFQLPTGTPPHTQAERNNQRLAAATLRLNGVLEDAIRRGLRARLPARAERFWLGGKEVLLDGAHNPDAARALLEHTQRPFVLLFGTLPKKLGAETLAVLGPCAEHVVLTNAVPGGASMVSVPGAELVEEPEAALNIALTRCREGGSVVVAGSFYLAGRLRPILVRDSS